MGSWSLRPGWRQPFRSSPHEALSRATHAGEILRRALEQAAWKLGLHPFPAPLAILSQAYRGRAGCIHCGHCEAFGCEVGAKSSSLSSVIPVAQQTGRCEIRTGSYVHRIEINRLGRATGAADSNAQRRPKFQKARAVIVSANGAETARLLLLSAHPVFPRASLIRAGWWESI